MYSVALNVAASRHPSTATMERCRVKKVLPREKILTANVIRVTPRSRCNVALSLLTI